MATSKQQPSDDDTPKTTTSDASAVREVSQDQTDHVAIVSRTATGEASQNPGYKVIGLPDDADEATKAAAENRPEKA